MKKIIYALLIVTFASASANAQGRNNADFNGPYIGGTVGYNSISADGLDDNVSGAAFGGLAGFRSEVGDGVYLGVEAFLNFNTASQEYIELGETIREEADESYGIVAQAGFAAGQALFFVNAGYGWATVSATTDVLGTPVSVSDSGGGVRLGGGVEVKITENLAVRAQADWQDFEGGSATGGTGALVLSF